MLAPPHSLHWLHRRPCSHLARSWHGAASVIPPVSPALVTAYYVLCTIWFKVHGKYYSTIVMAVKLLIFYSSKLLIYSTCRRGCSNFLEMYCQRPRPKRRFFCSSIAIFHTVRGKMCLKQLQSTREKKAFSGEEGLRSSHRKAVFSFFCSSHIFSSSIFCSNFAVIYFSKQ